MVLLLAADMFRSVLNACGVRPAHPQWTTQLYGPPSAWPFSTWAILAIMWHLAPEGNPAASAVDIAKDLHAWPNDQEFPWRRPRGDLLVSPMVKGLSLTATPQRHPDQMARPFLQGGTVPANPAQ